MEMDRSSFHAALDALRTHHDARSGFDLRTAFDAEPERFARFSLLLDDLLLDLSKCALSQETLALLEDLARAAGIEARRAAMFAGEHINTTEDRVVLHVALSDLSGQRMVVDGHDISVGVRAVLDALAVFSEGVSGGASIGATGSTI